MANESIFNMEQVNTVANMRDLAQAKQFVRTVITEKKSQVLQTTINRANNLVVQSRSINQLSKGMADWILAHPSNGLKVL